MISAIVLAAGESKRMGLTKLLLPIRGKSLLQLVIDNARQSKAGEVIVVLGAEAAKLRREIKQSQVKITENPSYKEGMSTSLRAGLKAVSPEAKAVLILLGDQPLVSASIIDALIAKYEESGSSMVAPAYDGKRGNPVLFDRSLIPELMGVTGDKGGREVIEKHPDQLATVNFKSAVTGSDIDSRDDYLEVCQLLKADDEPEHDEVR